MMMLAGRPFFKRLMRGHGVIPLQQVIAFNGPSPIASISAGNDDQRAAGENRLRHSLQFLRWADRSGHPAGQRSAPGALLGYKLISGFVASAAGIER